MDRDKIIDGILDVMEYTQSYDPEYLWRMYDKKERPGGYQDYKACIDEMHYEHLIESSMDVKPGKLGPLGMPTSSPEYTYLITLAIKGKRIKEAGGWVKTKARERRKEIWSNVVNYGTFGLVILGVLLQILSMRGAGSPRNKEEFQHSAPNESASQDADTLPVHRDSVQLTPIPPPNTGE